MVKLKDVYPLYLNNEAKQPNADLEVTDKFTGEVAFRVAQADAATIDAGIKGAVAAAEPMARLPGYRRQAVLQHCVDRFKQRFDELAYALCVEAGKPIKDSEGVQKVSCCPAFARRSAQCYARRTHMDVISVVIAEAITLSIQAVLTFHNYRFNDGLLLGTTLAAVNCYEETARRKGLPQSRLVSALIATGPAALTIMLRQAARVFTS